MEPNEEDGGNAFGRAFERRCRRNHFVEVGRIVDSRDPHRIGRAGMCQGHKGEQGKQDAEHIRTSSPTAYPSKDTGQSHRCLPPARRSGATLGQEGTLCQVAAIMERKSGMFAASTSLRAWRSG